MHWVQYEHIRTFGPITFFRFIDMWGDEALGVRHGVWIGRFRLGL